MANTTLNPADKSSNVVLSGGNLHVSSSTDGTDGAVRSVDAKLSGKYYFEIDCTNLGGSDTGAGIASNLADLSLLGSVAGDGALVFTLGYVYVNGTPSAHSIGSVSGNIVGVAVDLDNEKIWFRVNNGNWNDTSPGNDPVTNIGGLDLSGFATTGVTSIFPAASVGFIADSMTFNFGSIAFSYSPPSGFTAGWPENMAPVYVLSVTFEEDEEFSCIITLILHLACAFENDDEFIVGMPTITPPFVPPPVQSMLIIVGV